MYNLQTKESRLKSQEIQFKTLLESGYNREDYKGLKIFTNTVGKHFSLKIFKDNASNHIHYVYYRTEEDRNKAVESAKNSYDRIAAYKEERKSNKTLSTAANAAKAIREELKSNFAGVKFSVTSDNFAGGDSVNISWTDGATVRQVEEFTSKYQYGHFNGMEDIYEYTNDRSDIPQAKYVSESRSMSDETRESIKTMMIEKYSLEYWLNMEERDQDRKIYEYFTETDLHPEEEKVQPETATQTPTEPAKAGSIELIDYSDKAIAVIGETKPIKDILSALGGKFNFRLSCGAGWIFPKTKSEQVIKALQEIAAAKKQATPEVEQPEDKTPIIPTPETNVFILESFKIIWHEGRHIEGATFEGHIFNTWDDVQKTFVKLWEVNEKGQNAGYSKVKCEMKLKDNEIMIFRVDITDEIDNGDFNPSHEHIVKYLQSIADETEETILRHTEVEPHHPLNICNPESSQYKQALKEYEESHPKKYNSLLDIQQAAASGEQISMLNLFEFHQSNN